jgi:type I restriction enzyme M protein
VQLIDASSFWRKMRKSLGSKRKEMSDEQIATVTDLFGSFVEAKLATLIDAEVKEITREVVKEGQRPPRSRRGLCWDSLTHLRSA